MDVLEIERYGWHASTDKNSINSSQIVNTIDRPDLSELDLLVRECVQNSLDSALDLKDSRTQVYVDFLNQRFDGKGFLGFLGPTAEKSFTKFLGKRGLDSASLIAVRDEGTTGVDGDITDKKSRLFMLVTGFLNGKDAVQGQSGLGGSHGAGKTVVLKLGVGLVVYYTRVRISAKKYEQRLWVYYCENGAGQVFKGVTKDGEEYLPSRFAWWGRMRDGYDNCVEPITDEALIGKILATLGIRAFDNDKTGTVIIIPFIDEKKVLSTIQSPSLDSENDDARPLPWWRNSILNYLQHAAAKWYAPRIAQLSDDSARFRYFKGPSLVCKFGTENNLVSLNGASKDFAAFRLINRMFSIAVDNKIHADTGPLGAEPYKLAVGYGTRRWRSAWFGLKSGAPLGWVVLVKLSRTSDLVPELFPAANGSKDGIRMVYSRSPGLILSYDDLSWSTVLNPYPLMPDEALWGIFVPNVANKISPDEGVSLNGADDSFEAPFRDSEGFDHGKWPENATWPKCAIDGTPYKILSAVRNRLRQTIVDFIHDSGAEVGEDTVRAISTGALWGSFLGTGGSGFGGARSNPAGNLGRNKKPKNSGGSGLHRETNLQLGEPEYSVSGGRLRITYPFEVVFGEDDLTVVIEPAVQNGSGASSRKTFAGWAVDLKEKKTMEEFPCELQAVIESKLRVDNTKLREGVVYLQKAKVKKVEGSVSYLLRRNDIVTELKVSYVDPAKGRTK